MQTNRARAEYPPMRRRGRTADSAAQNSWLRRSGECWGVRFLERPEQGVNYARYAARDRTALDQRAKCYDDYGSRERLRWPPEDGDSDRGAAKDRDLQEGPCGSPGGMATLAVGQRPRGRCAGFRLHESQDHGLTTLVSTQAQGMG